MRANDFLTEKTDDVGQKIYPDGKTRVVNTPVADKNISMADQRIDDFATKRDMYNKGTKDAVISMPGTKQTIAKARANIKQAYSKQDKIDQRQGAGQSYITKGKPVKFDPKNSSSNVKIAMDDINEAFEYAIAEAREIDPKKMQAYMDFKKENNIDGSSVRMAVDNPDHPETKRMMQDKNFAKAVSMYKAALVNEDVSELTFEDDDEFFEDFGYLGYSIDENDLFEAEYRGRKVKLNKPMQGDVKKFKVYVKNKKGNVIKVNFGHGGSSVKGKTMRIRKNNPKARKNFRARHNCDNPGPKTKARYWSCRKW
jgi:hypothetical protein